MLRVALFPLATLPTLNEVSVTVLAQRMFESDVSKSHRYRAFKKKLLAAQWLLFSEVTFRQGGVEQEWVPKLFLFLASFFSPICRTQSQDLCSTEKLLYKNNYWCFCAACAGYSLYITEQVLFVSVACVKALDCNKFGGEYVSSVKKIICWWHTCDCCNFACITENQGVYAVYSPTVHGKKSTEIGFQHTVPTALSGWSLAPIPI